MNNNENTSLLRKELSLNKSPFFSGIKAGIPIAIGYIPIAIAFGLLAKSNNIPNHISIAMSLIVFAGASQFIAVNLLSLITGYPEIIMTTFIINLRHFLMTASLSQKLRDDLSKKSLLLLSFGVTDETFAMASLHKGKLEGNFMLGLNLIAYLAWTGGTAVGVFLGAGLPAIIQSSMGIALYVMFIGLLIPSVKKSNPLLIVAFIALGISSILYYFPIFEGFSAGWTIIITTIIASIIGAILFPEDGDNDE
ncbi:branched-chain amino acid ABC transporter permease [Orenia metallireducens]|uniref:Branched-chain amino acid ABC transporter permease n=1 Tax=Orenia metallireducens TaxID=1413210 RepID=A0A1C0A8E8_9FIRM|nr:AzlC family ABC transporter permease [Orenia metallireducens]OCL26526.1 branched-chain amino acid ABC transporter permease [Orenia metallireducens]